MERLYAFVDTNKTLLNAIVRQNPRLIDAKGSLVALVHFARCRACLDFDNKQTLLRTRLKKLSRSGHQRHGHVRVNVRRQHVLEDSFYQLSSRPADSLRGKLSVSFRGEEGVDAGGLTREWFTILIREIFNPNLALFRQSADSPTVQPNPLSYVNTQHLAYFTFVGRVIGKAIMEGVMVDAFFTRSFYKHILGQQLHYTDLVSIDPEYFKNLLLILDNQLDMLGLELTFSEETHDFGQVKVVDLKPDGRNIEVTDENKMEYVKLVAQHRMTRAIEAQLSAFLKVSLVSATLRARAAALVLKAAAAPQVALPVLLCKGVTNALLPVCCSVSASCVQRRASTISYPRI